MVDTKWISRFLGLAEYVSEWSKDPSTKVGAVIAKDKRIVSLGFNGFPRETKDNSEIYEDRERKYLRVLHAEANAILFAKTDLRGCCLYATHFPCCQCASLIIQSGITEVYVPRQTQEFIERWYEQIKESLAMFTEAHVLPFVFDADDDVCTRFYAYRKDDIEDY